MIGFGQKGRPTDDVPMLMELLSAAGYRGGEIGKSALFPLSRHPFDYRRYPKLGRGPQVLRPFVREFLSADDGRPFFLLMSLHDPHRPFPRQSDVEPGSVQVPAVLPDEPGVRREIARYYAGIERLDAVVGAVLDEIEAVGQAESTLVIFTSDHGASFPYAKGTLYDAGMRVPFVVRWPGVVQPGTSSDALISFVDVLPTLLEAAGADGSVPGEVDGRSFLEVLRGARAAHRQLVFGDLEFIPKHLPSRAVRSRDWKYVYNAPVDRPYGQEALTANAWASMRMLAESDPVMKARVEHLLRRPREELYDLAIDPAELNDLGADPRHADTRRELARALGCWMQTTGDPLVIPADRMADGVCEPELSVGFGAR
jgi:arylsulfatase A-like enzyme